MSYPRQEDLEQLWRRFSGELRGFIRRRVGDAAAVEDLLQEVFLRVHTRLGSQRCPECLRAWLYRIARNIIIDHARRRRPSVPWSDEAAGREDPAEETRAEERLAGSLRAMVDTLPPDDRLALLLTEFEGLTQRELADRLGISLSGAKSRVQRARRRLRDLLLECCHVEFDRRGAVVDYYERCCCCGDEPKSNHHGE